MSMDDPGWDDAGFDGGPHGGSGGNNGGWGAPTAGGPNYQRPTHATPAWTKPKVIVPVAGVAVAVIVVLAVLLATGGNSTPTAATSPPSTSTSPKPTPTHTTPKPTPKSTAPKLVSLADYDKNADHICDSDVPKIKRALANRNAKSLGSAIEDEYRRLQQVPTPDDDADQARQWIDDLTKTLMIVNSKNPNLKRYNADAKATGVLAGQLGMKSCQHALPTVPT